MLNEMRFGTLTASSIAKFKSLSRPVDYSDGLEPTELFPLRGEVDKSNLGRLKGIKQQMVKYLAQDGASSALV
jgi:ATP-dependent DNA helicase PIF1